MEIRSLLYLYFYFLLLNWVVSFVLPLYPALQKDAAANIISMNFHINFLNMFGAPPFMHKSIRFLG